VHWRYAWHYVPYRTQLTHPISLSPVCTGFLAIINLAKRAYPPYDNLKAKPTD